MVGQVVNHSSFWLGPLAEWELSPQVVMQGLTSAADSIIDDAALLARDAQGLSELPECIANVPCAALAPTLTALSGDFSGGPAGAAVASIGTLLAKPARIREKQIGGSGGSLGPPGPLFEPPGPLLTHLAPYRFYVIF